MAYAVLRLLFNLFQALDKLNRAALRNLALAVGNSARPNILAVLLDTRPQNQATKTDVFIDGWGDVCTFNSNSMTECCPLSGYTKDIVPTESPTQTPTFASSVCRFGQSGCFVIEEFKSQTCEEVEHQDALLADGKCRPWAAGKYAKAFCSKQSEYSVVIQICDDDKCSSCSGEETHSQGCTGSGIKRNAVGQCSASNFAFLDECMEGSPNCVSMSSNMKADLFCKNFPDIQQETTMSFLSMARATKALLADGACRTWVVRNTTK